MSGLYVVGGDDRDSVFVGSQVLCRMLVRRNCQLKHGVWLIEQGQTERQFVVVEQKGTNSKNGRIELDTYLESWEWVEQVGKKAQLNAAYIPFVKMVKRDQLHYFVTILE